MTTNTDFTCDPNYLTANQFKLVISRKDYPAISFFAQQVMHPSVELGEADLGFPRTALTMPGDVLTFGTLSMDILLDEKMVVYEEMFKWMKRVVETKNSPNTGSLYNSETASQYADIQLLVLTSSNNASRSFKYVNAYPISLGDITFTATSDGAFITFPISFRYDYFDFE